MDNNIFSIFKSSPNTEVINEVYSEIIKKTTLTISKWTDFIENEGSQRSYKIMLDWQISLTNSLQHWISLDKNIPIGDLILARINIGMLVETWLKIFFTIYSYDYQNDKSDSSKIIRNNKKKKIEIKDLKFNQSIDFFLSKVDPRIFYRHCPLPKVFLKLLGKEEIDSLFNNRRTEVEDYKYFKKWLNKIRDTRNSVHSFAYREIGTYSDFIEDVIKFNTFLDIIIRQLPSRASEDGESHW